MNKPTIPVTHNPQARRFEACVDGVLCVATYDRADHVMTMTHTFVAPALEGRGIAAALVAQALAFAAREGLRVRPACSYVARYMQRHPATLGLLDAGPGAASR